MMENRILIADSDSRMLFTLKDYLEIEGYRVTLAENGKDVMEKAKIFSPDIVLLDLLLPDITGFEVMGRLHELRPFLPVIMLSQLDDFILHHEAFYRGAEDFCVKPLNVPDLLTKVKKALLCRSAIEKWLPKDGMVSIARAWARAVSQKDEYTGNHSERVSLYCFAIGQELPLSSDELTKLMVAALTHDVGKIGIPDKILLKPGKLDPDEWKIMQSHAQMTYDTLSIINIPWWNGTPSDAASHHETWDGTGYPKGLKGEEIPLLGRIIAVADIFDAVSTRRSYKEAFTVDRSIDIIRTVRGINLDPEIVDIFLKTAEKGDIINLVNS